MWTLLLQLCIFRHVLSQIIADENVSTVLDKSPVKDTLITAITIDKYDAPDDANAEVPVTTHFMCFLEDHVSGTISKKECCASLLRLNQNIFDRSLVDQNYPGFDIWNKDTDIQRWSRWCIDKLAIVQRTVPSSKSSLLIPIYYLLNPKINSTVDWDQSGQFQQHQYVQQGDCLYKDEAALTPFHLTRNLQILDEVDNQHRSCSLSINDFDEHITATAKILSSLSEKGGMHRVFHQKLVLSFPPYQLKEEEKIRRNDQIILNGNVTIFMPISENIFIDVDDPLVLLNDETCKLMQINGIMDSSFSCMVTLVQNSNQVVDIEQPSFASPQHVIVFNLQFEALASVDDDWFKKPLEFEMEFNPILHFRYPAPLAALTNDNSYVTVQVATPTIFSGSYNLTVANNHYGTYSINFLPSKQLKSLITSRVASGLYTHHSGVIFSTLSASIVDCSENGISFLLSSVGR